FKAHPFHEFRHPFYPTHDILFGNYSHFRSVWLHSVLPILVRPHECSKSPAINVDGSGSFLPFAISSFHLPFAHPDGHFEIDHSYSWQKQASSWGECLVVSKLLA